MPFCSPAASWKVWPRMSGRAVRRGLSAHTSCPLHLGFYFRPSSGALPERLTQGQRPPIRIDETKDRKPTIVEPSRREVTRRRRCRGIDQFWPEGVTQVHAAELEGQRL